MLDAATGLFAARGVHRVGGNTVIAEAGVAKASFYKHFLNKADLVAAILADDVLQAGGEDPTERVGALFNAWTICSPGQASGPHHQCVEQPYLATP